MDRRERRDALDRLKARPGPWTAEEWREWAAVAAADVLDRGYAHPRQPDGTYPMDHAFAVSGRMLVVGPWTGDSFAAEVGSRAAKYAEEVTR